MIAFNKYYNQFNILSISLVVISLLLLIFKGLNFGIDFKGGTLIEVRSTDSKINVSSLRDNLRRYLDEPKNNDSVFCSSITSKVSTLMAL